MYPPGGPRQPEVDFDQIIGGLRNNLGRISGRLGGGGVWGLILLGIGLIVVIWIATGIYRLGPGEQSAQRRFGAICGEILGPCSQNAGIITQTGLHWWWPTPVGKKDRVKVTETRRMELGFRTGSAEGVAVEGLMISGDLNIVDVQMVVQYNIKDLAGYLFRVDDPGELDRNIPPGQPDGRTLKDAAEAAIRLVVGQRTIEDVLTEQRTEVESETKERLQEFLDRYAAGINILSVQLLKTQAPEEVFEAFEDVLRARQEKETRINEARTYENSIIPRAQGDAERIKREAEAFRQARVARAQGEAGRFISVLDAFRDHSIQLRNELQDTNNADGDGDSATGIGLADVVVIDGKQTNGGGFDILVDSLEVLGADPGSDSSNNSNCVFSESALLAAGDSATRCVFSVSFKARVGEPTTGEQFSIAYLGNESIALPPLVESGPFEVRLSNAVLDTNNQDGDDDMSTGINVSDITVVAEINGGNASDAGIRVSGFDPYTNIATFNLQQGGPLKPGDVFTVQYLNKENLTIPATSEVTQQRLYLEAIEGILPNVNKIIVSPDAESVLLLGGRGEITPVPLGPRPSP